MFKSDSLLMIFFRNIGLESVAWSLRRLYCPVDKDALVLEVGSGGNPYARSNVLLDAYETTRERHWVPLVADRPMVLGFVEKLPFKDKVFDFVIASHVLEHSPIPEQFLSELSRVAKAGYIEVPDAFFERINPYRDHRLEITCRNNKLIIRKKKAWVVEKETVQLYEHAVKPVLTTRLVPRHPFAFHTRYYWEDAIEYTIVNSEVQAAWEAEPSNPRVELPAMTIKARIQNLLLNLIRFLLSQKKRNKNIDVFSLLICPKCKTDALSRSSNNLVCENCKSEYIIKNDIPVFS